MFIIDMLKLLFSVETFKKMVVTRVVQSTKAHFFPPWICFSIVHMLRAGSIKGHSIVTHDLDIGTVYDQESYLSASFAVHAFIRMLHFGGVNKLPRSVFSFSCHLLDR